tara:strand:- start:1685 stop:3589 length:1905 start_codon:yes stop_codon:yes gene_type:complete
MDKNTNCTTDCSDIQNLNNIKNNSINSSILYKDKNSIRPDILHLQQTKTENPYNKVNLPENIKKSITKSLLTLPSAPYKPETLTTKYLYSKLNGKNKQKYTISKLDKITNSFTTASAKIDGIIDKIPKNSKFEKTQDSLIHFAVTRNPDNDISEDIIVKTVKNLIEKGENPDVSNFQGKTPLMIASQNHDVNVVELLLNNKCKPLTKCANGFTALHYTIFPFSIPINSNESDSQLDIQNPIYQTLSRIEELKQNKKTSRPQELFNDLCKKYGDDLVENSQGSNPISDLKTYNYLRKNDKDTCKDNVFTCCRFVFSCNKNNQLNAAIAIYQYITQKALPKTPLFLPVTTYLFKLLEHCQNKYDYDLTDLFFPQTLQSFSLDSCNLNKINFDSRTLLKLIDSIKPIQKNIRLLSNFLLYVKQNVPQIYNKLIIFTNSSSNLKKTLNSSIHLESLQKYKDSDDKLTKQILNNWKDVGFSLPSENLDLIMKKLLCNKSIISTIVFNEFDNAVNLFLTQFNCILQELFINIIQNIDKSFTNQMKQLYNNNNFQKILRGWCKEAFALVFNGQDIKNARLGLDLLCAEIIKTIQQEDNTISINQSLLKQNVIKQLEKHILPSTTSYRKLAYRYLYIKYVTI